MNASIEVGQQAGTPYLVSEFVPGVTLADWLTAHRATPRQAAELVAHLADADGTDERRSGDGGSRVHDPVRSV